MQQKIFNTISFLHVLLLVGIALFAILKNENVLLLNVYNEVFNISIRTFILKYLPYIFFSLTIVFILSKYFGYLLSFIVFTIYLLFTILNLESCRMCGSFGAITSFNNTLQIIIFSFGCLTSIIGLFYVIFKKTS